MANLKFKVEALRTLTSPYRKGDKDESTFETIYYLLADMKELPSSIPMDVNPREPKMTTNVARSLLAAVVEPETDFYINNRGIVIAAKSLTFNSTESEVTIDIGNQNDENDKFLYGILDGGHTYTAIMRKRDEIPENVRKYVRIEVITNVQNITRLSDARNTSIQVSDLALFNLDDKFDNVKSAIAGQTYADLIAYKDNENKPINISELLRLMYAFDIDRYPDDNAAPVQSYSGKAQVFKRYKQAFESPFYKSLTKQLPLLVELYDVIERELPEKYKEYKKRRALQIRVLAVLEVLNLLILRQKQNFLLLLQSILFQVDTFIRSSALSEACSDLMRQLVQYLGCLIPLLSGTKLVPPLFRILLRPTLTPNLPVRTSSSGSQTIESLKRRAYANCLDANNY